jgi:hypothetical protein
VVAIIGGVIAAVLGAVSIGESGAAAALIFVFVGFYVLLPILALAYYAAFLREMIGTLSLSTLDFEFTARTKDWFVLMFGNVMLYLGIILIAAILAGALGIASLPTSPEALANPPVATFAIIVLAVAVPLGLVGGFVRYRNWRFFIRHLEAGGEINLVALTQSRAPEPRQGEGLLDALDMGGF